VLDSELFGNVILVIRASGGMIVVYGAGDTAS
jgi:hypothetical protein